LGPLRGAVVFVAAPFLGGSQSPINALPGLAASAALALGFYGTRLLDNGSRASAAAVIAIQAAEDLD